MISVNRNFGSLVGQLNLKATTSAVDTAVQRLSSGARVNSAADDSAGFAVVSKMDSQIKGLSVALKNTADAMIHSVKASIEEHGEKLDPGEREKVESAIKECEEAVKTEDKGKIQSSSEALTAAAQKLGELAMAAANKSGDKAQSPGGENSVNGVNTGEERGEEKKVDDVVDAEFKEVKRD